MRTRTGAAVAPVGDADLPGGLDEPLPFALLRGERVLWAGRPDAKSFARRILHIRWIAAYFAAFVVVGLFQDRRHGLSIPATLKDALPLAIIAVAFLVGCYGVARTWAGTTRYVVTSERCVFHIGIALTGTLSIPWSRVAQVCLARHGDGCGDIALSPMRPHRLKFLKLWPHVRPWRVLQPEPMLRCVPRADELGNTIRAAIDAAARRRSR